MSIQDFAAVASEYDFQFWVDTSGSMNEPNKSGASQTRWEAAQEMAFEVARDISAIDTDGITVGVFGGGSGIQFLENAGYNNAREFLSQYSPRGGTPTAAALQQAFQLAKSSTKKDFIIVVTDGIPDDLEAVKTTIKNQANSQEADNDVTVLFLQAGNDPSATKFLQGLDDNLKGAKFDIVDAKTQEQVYQFKSTAELILAAIND